ncbi:RCC1 and BTB domain-containing protein 1-like [Cloeon dipterum]|uniref:RCC1 and BTB domain-containing protein 1-like n=1 Tax=Cloeon dipterum TaxID=197152 RepID=UPI0032208DF2
MSKLLLKWDNFGYQNSEIRTALVFGINAENVIIVLQNDEVLALGTNQIYCLGTGVEGEVKELKRIENLCGQRIEGFEFTGVGCLFCLFAICESGSVFSWGGNGYGQLGLGTTGYTQVPTKILGCLEQKKVVQVACGGDHTLALTSEGEVYAFGRNANGELGLGTTDRHFLPQRVGGLLDGKIVTSVACQMDSSLALLRSGQICAWGSNLRGKLGLPSTSVQECSPCMVLGLEGVVIYKIVCGIRFTLALSDDGKIYSWGDNFRGYLGNGTTKIVKRPAIISQEMGRVKDIAATQNLSHPCAAINEKNHVYCWGSCNDQIVEKPMLTSFSSFDEVYVDASPPITYHRFQSKNTNYGRKMKGSVIERFQRAFDNPETTDFAFIVEGKKIHVHKNLLTVGSDVFKNLFLGNWKDSHQKELIVEDHSYDAFYAFLKYFYTDEIDHEIPPELVLDLYSVAHFYQVTDLLDECEKILKSGLSVQIAAAVYEKAILFGAKDLCEFCMKFCKEHLLEVLENFDSDDCKREFILEVYRRAANQKKN